MFAKFYPNLVSGVVINTGMMEQSFMTADYPEQKLAVFLASPTDLKYNEMRRDLAFLILTTGRPNGLSSPVDMHLLRTMCVSKRPNGSKKTFADRFAHLRLWMHITGKRFIVHKFFPRPSAIFRYSLMPQRPLLGERRGRITEKLIDRAYLTISTDGRIYWYGIPKQQLLDNNIIDCITIKSLYVCT